VPVPRDVLRLCTAVLVAACTANTDVPPARTPTPDVTFVTFPPTATPRRPRESILGRTPATSPGAATGSPDPSSVATRRPRQPAEQLLLAQVPAAFRSTCYRRSTTNVSLAVAGVECAPPAPGVARIGYYLYRSTDEMYSDYYTHLREHGVQENSGECERGAEGEQAWGTPGRGYRGRIACFLNAFGYANIRWTQEDLLIRGGILGRSADISAVYRFWRDQAGPFQ
jgi:hypothetical protein